MEDYTRAINSIEEEATKILRSNRKEMKAIYGYLIGKDNLAAELVRMRLHAEKKRCVLTTLASNCRTNARLGKPIDHLFKRYQKYLSKWKQESKSILDDINKSKDN